MADFNELYDRYFLDAYRYFTLRIYDDVKVREMMEKLFLYVYEKADIEPMAVYPFLPFMYSYSWKLVKNEPIVVPGSVSGGTKRPVFLQNTFKVDAGGESAMIPQAMFELVSHLDVLEREVLWLKFFEEMTDSEIVKTIQMHPKEAPRKIYDVLQKVRELLVTASSGAGKHINYFGNVNNFFDSIKLAINITENAGLKDQIKENVMKLSQEKNNQNMFDRKPAEEAQVEFRPEQQFQPEEPAQFNPEASFQAESEFQAEQSVQLEPELQSEQLIQPEVAFQAEERFQPEESVQFNPEASFQPEQQFQPEPEFQPDSGFQPMAQITQDMDMESRFEAVPEQVQQEQFSDEEPFSFGDLWRRVQGAVISVFAVIVVIAVGIAIYFGTNVYSRVTYIADFSEEYKNAFRKAVLEKVLPPRKVDSAEVNKINQLVNLAVNIKNDGTEVFTYRELSGLRWETREWRKIEK
ncbi:MAG: hypothetical protein US89_C0006G0018 [Candidatus Peregrinibacteria bacterium GW2011_GWF2_38_29]|nr:MAG: hypothetical protein US89_C0006G0018 [Candidatus Peregrinibacteria bacterium GW2011_GWF2_38_29]HBB03208.1 hypothetical protein [Candidatus Peregrinibacteria bacterium]